MLVCNNAPVKRELVYKHIGALIKNRRKHLGLTQEGLASQLAISRASLASIETGRQNVLVHQLYTFAAKLQLAVTDFLPEQGNPISTQDINQLPLPGGLNSHQKNQIARLFLDSEDFGARAQEDSHDKQAKTRPKKAGPRTT